MYTWGSSPQALRLANQIKRRANAKQKNEEAQRREMSKRFEATLSENVGVTTVEADINVTPVPTVDAPLVAATATTPGVTLTSPISEKPLVSSDADISIVKDKIPLISGEDEIVIDNTPVIPAAAAAASSTTVVDAPVADINIQLIEDEIVADIPVVKTTHSNAQEKAEIQSEATVVPPTAAIIDVDPCEHMTPHLVDTSEVAGQILQVGGFFIFLFF